jgi:hypothetical protein
MERIIDTQFLRVEKALSTLIASIATYNPSPHLATDLVAADQELTKGLELCAYHPCEIPQELQPYSCSLSL